MAGRIPHLARDERKGPKGGGRLWWIAAATPLLLIGCECPRGAMRSAPEIRIERDQSGHIIEEIER